MATIPAVPVAVKNTAADGTKDRDTKSGNYDDYHLVTDLSFQHNDLQRSQHVRPCRIPV